MSDRTDEEIVARSEAALRYEMDPATERLRMLQVERETTRRACETLADLYSSLQLGKWAEKGYSVKMLAEIVAEEVLAARARIVRLEAQLATFTGMSNE
jgi:hypothetical protein